MKKIILILFISVTLVNGLFSQVSLLDQYKANNHSVITTTYSPNGELMATSGYDQTIIIRDRKGELVKRLKGHKFIVRSLAFSHDNKFIVGGGYKKDVYVWDTESGLLTYKLEGHKKNITSVDVSKNNIIASASEDETIIFWDLNSGQQIQKVDAHDDLINTLAFSADGTLLASGAADELVKVWDGKTGALKSTFTDTEKKAGKIKCVAFSPDGKSIASSDDNGRIVIWSTFTNLKKNTIEVNGGDAISIKYSPDGRYLAAGTSGKNFTIYNPETSAIIYTYTDHKDKVYALSFSPDGKYLINCDYSNNLYLWDVKQLGIEESLASLNKTSDETTSETPKVTANVSILRSDVDKNIPNVCSNPNKKRFALIIGNEDYSSHQMGLDAEVNVDYAINDAKAFKQYANQVLCVPEDNIILLTDAKAVEMHRSIEKMSLLTEITGPETELFLYYAGHGFPDEVTKEPYIMPVDVSGSDLRFAINLKELYGKLTEHPHTRVTVFLDACFSGGARNQGLLAARGVKIVPKNNDLLGKLVVFSASSGQESSLPYHDKEHGLFTYYLLKKLQDSKGDISYKELGDYLKEEVAKNSILKNDKPQNPQVNVSPSAQQLWSNWQIKK